MCRTNVLMGRYMKGYLGLMPTSTRKCIYPHILTSLSLALQPPPKELMIPSLFFNNMTLYIFSLLILILSSCSINYVDSFSFSSKPFEIISSTTNKRASISKRCSSSRATPTILLMSAGEAALPMPLEEEGTFCV